MRCDGKPSERLRARLLIGMRRAEGCCSTGRQERVRVRFIQGSVHRRTFMAHIPAFLFWPNNTDQIIPTASLMNTRSQALPHEFTAVRLPPVRALFRSEPIRTLASCLRETCSSTRDAPTVEVWQTTKNAHAFHFPSSPLPLMSLHLFFCSTCCSGSCNTSLQILTSSSYTSPLHSSSLSAFLVPFLNCAYSLTGSLTYSSRYDQLILTFQPVDSNNS